MKRLSKIFVTMLAFVMMLTASFALVGCGDDVENVNITVSYYDGTSNQEKQVVIPVELYREYAPETVEAMIEYIDGGYFNDCIFYKTATESNVLKVGDLKMVDGQIVKNAVKPTIDGEFEHGKVKGSPLQNKKGSIGLWRTWTAHDGTFMTSKSTDTGRATWYMPLTDTLVTSYEGWFCVFAQIDMEASGVADAFTALDLLFLDTASYDEYVVYYTGEYDESKPDQDHGLEFHAVLAEEFNEETEVFEAEGEQLVCYNKVTIRVAKVPETTKIGAKIVKAEVE